MSTKQENSGEMEVFTFGDPTPVLDNRDFFASGEAYWNGRWYDTPISMDGLAKSYNAAIWHASAIQVKRNLLVKNFIPHKWLTRAEFYKLATDFLIFGNAYIEMIPNHFKRPIGLKHSPAKYTRKTKSGYLFIRSWNDVHEFDSGAIFHLLQYDINQELYGIPEYISGLQNVWLDEAATLFRRRYYTNGGHAGFILYINDASQSHDDIEKIREAMNSTRGIGNFRNLFMYAPNGKQDGVQVIPLSEIQAKDEFRNIRDKTREAQIGIHRVPVQNFGAPPENVGGYGDVEKANRVMIHNEIETLQTAFDGINEWIGSAVIKFKPFTFDAEQP